eukprot:364843-Chlamydomonas_euryale.AAC.10
MEHTSTTELSIRPCRARKNHRAHCITRGHSFKAFTAVLPVPLLQPSPPPFTSIPQPRVRPLCGLSPRARISHQPGLAPPRAGTLPAKGCVPVTNGQQMEKGSIAMTTISCQGLRM